MTQIPWITKQKLPKATIFEVGPRDGLQNESRVLDVDQRAELIQKLIATGIRNIEVGSFVRADKIPALANSDQVIRKVLKNNTARSSDIKFWAFVPNQKGFDDALDAGINGVALFVASSNTFCKKNVNSSVSEQKEIVKVLLANAQKNKVPSRVYLSTIVYCPYEGEIAPERVCDLANELLDMGASKVVLSDTTGHATPASLAKLLELCLKHRKAKDFSLHMHDTRGLALANVMEGLRAGIDEFDSSIAGLGGCPYAPGASGNLSTEDLAYLLTHLEILDRVDMQAIANAGFFVEACLGKRGPSKVLRTFSEK